MKKIFFTGGGSGGHAITALTLIRKIKQINPDWEVLYIGSQNGIERKLAHQQGLQYKAILTGKLRRYFSFENMKDFFKVFLAIVQVYFYLAKNKSKNTVLFSTGGFVSVPPVIAARLLGIPVYVHEQTTRVGLANKIASKFATKVFISFEDSKKYFPASKTIFTGYPVREECNSEKITNDKIAGISLSNVDRPILFITGGGNGSQLINTLIEKKLSDLKRKYFIIHQVGSDYQKYYEKFNDENYLAVDFVENILDIMKISEVIISRSGAGTVAELIALNRPSIFIPLKIAQKNEQYHNAMEAKRILGSIVIEEDQLDQIDIIQKIEEISQVPKKKITHSQSTASEKIISEISA